MKGDARSLDMRHEVSRSLGLSPFFLAGGGTEHLSWMG